MTTLTHAPSKKPTVLIVDDVADNLQILSAMLYPKGFNILLAQSGAEALTIVTRETPDIILLDIIMPVMDGFEVCRRLKRKVATQNIPIIFLTAKSDTEDILKGFNCGAVDYILKPFQPEELFVRVSTHVTLKSAQELQASRRLLSEEALRRSEQQYRSLAENVADGVGIVQGGRLVFVNDAFSRIFGQSIEQLLALDPLELFHQDFQEEFRTLVADSTGSVFKRELHMLCLDHTGREIWIEQRNSRIEWEERPALIVTMRDISAQKLRELANEREREQLQQTNIALRSSLKDRYRLGDILGKSPVMQTVYELILKAALSEVNVVISGESGTGKELVAWTIHTLSERRKKSFIPVNCGAIPENLFESEFFGHRKGAFTGAYKDQKGFFDHAVGGTLFLDELAELPLPMQVKLLRVLAGDGYTPVGDHLVRKSDVRILAATNKHLKDLVKAGGMREDFYYRVTVVQIELPPLRERREDIPLLIDHFLRQLSGESQPLTIPGEVLRDLYEYDWPGNVRELQNALQRYLTTNQLDFIAPGPPPAQPRPGEPSAYVPTSTNFHEASAAFEKQFILTALEQERWNRTKTAALLGISRRSLFRQMEKHGLLSPTTSNKRP